MEKIIKADIDCLLATIRKSVNDGNMLKALDAAEMLKERIGDLMRVDALREVSNDHKS